jgi:hypothetical protein
MKNNILKLIGGLFFISLLMISCQEDPWDAIDEYTFHERNILSVDLGVFTTGTPIISRDETSASIELFILGEPDFDIAAVPVDYVAVSYGASTTARPGSTLDFNNAELKSTITVTSETGESLDWDIYLSIIPINYAEMQNQAVNGGVWWWTLFVSGVEWKETFDVSGYWIDDANGNIAGTRQGNNVRPAWADAVTDNLLTMTPDGKFTVNPGLDGEFGGPALGNYNVLSFASGRFYYQIDSKVVTFIDDATGNEQKWVVRTDLIPNTKVVFNLGQTGSQGAGSTTILELR